MKKPASLAALFAVAVASAAAPVAAQVPADAPADEVAEPEQAARSYGLEALLEAARANAAVLEEHEARIRQAEWQQYRAKWAWGPKVSNEALVAPVPAQADPDQIDQNFDEIANLNIGPFITNRLRVVVPVWTFDRITIARKLAEIGVDVAELERVQAERDLEFQVKRAFYALQLSGALRALLEEGGGLIKEKLAEMEVARDFGEAEFDTKDFRKLQIFDAEVDARVLDNDKLAGISEAGLAYFTGLEGDFGVAALGTEEEPLPLATLADYLAFASEYRPELLMLRRGLKAAGLNVELKESEFYPNIFVATEFNVGWSTEELALRHVCRVPAGGGECVAVDDLYARPYSDPFDSLSWRIGLGLKWDFDFWQLRGKLGEAEAKEATVRAQYEQATDAIELEIRKLYIEAAQARQKVEVQARRLDAARRWRDQFGLTLQQGGADLEEGVEPLKAYFEAQALYLQARFDYLVARAALAEGIGAEALVEVPRIAPSPESSD